MRTTNLFTKTSKTAPAGEVSLNAQLLLRAGYVYKEMAGVYAYLPLGLRVINNIKQIIREEMDAIGGQELIMTNLQEPAVWETTGRWSSEVVDVWFKTKLQDDTELGLAWSHEEPIMRMISQYVNSYRDLPFAVYQFQTKLRNELRAKSGIMRGREFVMKDMYSLHATKEDSDAYYEKVKQAYVKIFERFGLGKETFVTFASGGAFTKFSHEFQTICDAGEDWLYIDRERNIGVNEEVLDDAVAELGLDRAKMEKVRSAEVGNIFNFGTDKSEAMKITYKNEKNEDALIYLNSYGIGVNRVMGVFVEKFSDEKGIVWSPELAPFKAQLIGIGEAGVAKAEEIYAGNEEVFLYDDRAEARPGEKFADADLMGMPYRVVVSDKSIAAGGVELTVRATGETKVLTFEEFSGTLAEW